MTTLLRRSASCLALFAFFSAVPSAALAQAKPAELRENIARGHLMLHSAYEHIQKDYYDPTFHGIDLEARYKQMDAAMNNAQSLGQTFGIIMTFLSGFHDSHLYFMPPDRNVRLEPGYRLRMVGDRCFVLRVRPGSDAASKLHPGDEVVAFNGLHFKRQDLGSMQRYFHTLAPRSQDQLEVVRDGKHEQITTTSIVVQRKSYLDLVQNDNDYRDMMLEGQEEDKRDRERTYEAGDVMVWKMPSFSADPATLSRIFAKARKHSMLVIDLRGNPGGAISTLEEVVGHLFDHPVKIADRVGRHSPKPMIAKPVDRAYTGKLVVLVDSDSASCAELLARTVQLEHRGTVLGDRSGGFVMEAIGAFDQVGMDVVVPYGFSITDADLRMADGKSLEGVGVTPDETVLPSATDLAENRDPVLVKAVAAGGLTMTPDVAGKLFAYEWAPLK